VRHLRKIVIVAAAAFGLAALTAVASGISGEPANSVLSAPVLPDLEDPLEVDADIDLTAEEIDGITGNVKFVGQVVGTSTIYGDLSIGL
jgi:hypothetical protein